MQLGTEEILTPFLELGDDPAYYQLDWRHRVAMVIANNPKTMRVPNQFKADEWIKNDAAYLRALAKGVTNLAAKHAHCYVANGWGANRHGNQVQYYLQPLLLTAYTLDEIAVQMNTPVTLIQTYERLYYAVRTDAGVLPAHRLVTHMAAHGANLEITPDSPPQERWKAEALCTTGQLLLQARWGLVGIEERDIAQYKAHNAKLGVALLEQRVLNGHIASEDLLSLVAAEIEQRKFDHELKTTTGDNPLQDVLYRILQLSQMQKPVIELTAADIELQDAAVQQRLLSEKTIKQTVIEDNGPEGRDMALTSRLRSQAQSVKTRKKGDTK